MVAIRWFFLAMAVAVLAAVPVATAETAADRLTVVTSTGEHPFTVEVMRTPAELEKGLMFRRRLAPNSGMLFDFGQEQQVSMWMKNTYLPLDMLFIGVEGRVVSVKEDAKPMSEDIIASGGPVLGVLEVGAGTVRRIGVAPGDLVRHPLFRN